MNSGFLFVSYNSRKFGAITQSFNIFLSWYLHIYINADVSAYYVRYFILNTLQVLTHLVIATYGVSTIIKFYS